MSFMRSGCGIDVPAADRQTYIVGDAETVTWDALCRPIARSLGFELESIFVSGDVNFAVPRRRIRDMHCFASLRVNCRDRSRRRYAPAMPSGSDRKASQSSAAAVNVTEERWLLHTCGVKLTFAKAEREIGYKPVVSFAEAVHRSIGWLAFAGYPVVKVNGET